MQISTLLLIALGVTLFIILGPIMVTLLVSNRPDTYTLPPQDNKAS